jgi:V-type H+-transporting ATPase subunit a
MAKNSAFPSLSYLRLFLVREKYLYENLNCMKMQQSLFTCKVWLREKTKP